MARTYEELRAMSRIREKRYRQSEKGKAAHRSYRSKTLNKYYKQDNARSMVKYYVKTGKLIKPAVCEKNSSVCSGRIEAHHMDYGKPLDVNWLCIRHHKELHLGTS